jgi:hypothetical protein
MVRNCSQEAEWEKLQCSAEVALELNLLADRKIEKVYII